MRKVLPWAAILVLIITIIFAQTTNKMDNDMVQEYYRQMIPEATNFEPINDRVAKAIGTDGDILAYLGVSADTGYGGPILVGSVFSTEGVIQDVIILEHKETPSYIYKIEKAGYFRQYEKKQINNALTFGYDIDGVGGATLSTQAIANGVQEVAHIVAAELNITPEKADLPIQIGVEEIVVAALFVGALFLSRYKALARFRLVFLGFSVVVLGFWLNRSLSMAHISALFLGYFPAPSENLIWYIVLLGAILPALFLGKNIYCSYVCPFCALQEATHLISKVNLSIGKYMKWVKLVKNVLLFAVLFIAFLNLNPSISSYEPFGTIFGLNGSSLSWYLLFVILITSFFFRRFWCIALCPVGTFLNKVSGLGRKIRGKVKPTISIENKGAARNEKSCS